MLSIEASIILQQANYRKTESSRPTEQRLICMRTLSLPITYIWLAAFACCVFAEDVRLIIVPNV